MKYKKIILLLLLVVLILVSYAILFRKPITLKEDLLISARNDSIDKVLAAAKAEANKPWKLQTFVDDFGDTTNEKYIYTTSIGTFSNSATTNSLLYVKIIFEKSTIGIFLHEYKASTPAVSFIGNGTIKLKNSEGKILNLTSSSEWNESGGLALHNESHNGYPVSKVREFIKQSVGDIKVVVMDEYSSVYSFSIDATGFLEEYSML